MKVEELELSDCLDVLKRTKLGRIACSLNEQPYIIPFNFSFDGKSYLYGFSSAGQHIGWMRQNPLVCVEVEDKTSQEDWTTLIVYGRYEELPDEPEFQNQRQFAYELLSRQPMWWQPAYVSGLPCEEALEKTVFFRISVDKVTGHRSVSESFESFVPKAVAPVVQKNWLQGFW